MRRKLIFFLVVLLGAKSPSAGAQPLPSSNWNYPSGPPVPFYGPAGYGQRLPQPGNSPFYMPSYGSPEYLQPSVPPSVSPAAPPPLTGNNGAGKGYYPVSDPSTHTPSLPPRTVWPPQEMVLPPAPPQYFSGADFPPELLPEKMETPHHRHHDKLGWFSIGYMSSWLRPDTLRTPLITTGSATDAAPGAIGQPGTVTLFGGNDLDFGRYDGIRAEVGIWLGEGNRYSVDGSGFVLFQNQINFATASDAAGNPVLVRPIVDVTNQTESGFIVALPGFASGSTTIEAESEVFGAEVNGRHHIYCTPHLHWQTLVGFRFLNLNESLQIVDRLNPLVNDVFTFAGEIVNPPNSIMDRDRFATTNRFYGFQLGGQLRWDIGRIPLLPPDHDFGRLSLTAFGKVALGITDQEVDINGETTLLSPTGNQTVPGGILAVASNSGNHNRVVLGVVPEVGLNLDFFLTRNISFKTGYSFLVWNAVVRPSSHIDRNVNPAQVPSDSSFGTPGGPPNPIFAFQDEGLWIHNLFFGIEIRH